MNRFVLRTLLRRWWLLLAVASGVAIPVFVASQRATPIYSASTRIFVNQVQSPGTTGYNDLLASEQLATTYSELAHSGPVLAGTIERLGLQYNPDVLDRKVGAKVVRETQIVQITVQDADPKLAAAIANGLSDVLIQRARSIQGDPLQAARSQADGEVDDARQAVADVTARLNRIPVADGNFTATQERSLLQHELMQDQDRYFQALGTQQRLALAQTQLATAASVVSPAGPPALPVGPTTARSAMLAILLALLAAGMIGVAVVFLDDRIIDAEQLRQRFALAPLATVGNIPRKRAHASTDPASFRTSGTADALRSARARLQVPGATIVCVTSARRHEGATTIAAHWATMEAHYGKRVALVDANLRNPAIHRLFNLGNSQGLSTMATVPSFDAESALQEGPDNLQILTSGPSIPHPMDVLDTARMAELLDHLRESFDLVILDGAPLLSSLDTAVLQQRVDATVLVVNCHTGTRTLARALDRLRHASAHATGAIVTMHRPREARPSPGASSASGHSDRNSTPSPEWRDTESEDDAALAIERASI